MVDMIALKVLNMKKNHLSHKGPPKSRPGHERSLDKR